MLLVLLKKGSDYMKKIILSIVAVLCITLLVSGGTYAYFIISTNGNTNGVASSANQFNIIFTKGEELSGTLDPSDSRNDSMKASANIRLATGATRATVNVYLNVEEISSSLSNGSLKWEVEAKKNGNSVTISPSSGDFTACAYNNTTRACQDGDKLYIVRDYLLDYVDTEFTVYIWLNDSLVSTSVADAVFNASIGADTGEFTGQSIGP